MSLEENKAIVRRVLEALDQKNLAILNEHPGFFETVQRQPLLRTAFPDLQTTIEHQIAEGDTVATRAILRGTHLGPFMGATPTGKQLSWNILLMDQIVDGKIVVHYANADWINVLIQLGVVPPPSAPSKT